MNTEHNILVGVIDHLPPEAQAMIIAKYSRSYGTVTEWIPTTPEEIESLSKRMGVTYQGYGHKSVGQLGHTTIFLEGVSQLAAKAIEDTPLFNGQESSTRYIDYSNQPMVVISHHPDYDRLIGEYQEKFRALYIRALPLVTARLKQEYPCVENQTHPDLLDGDGVKRLKVWENTIKARTFDICRGLLPAGSVTNVAFTGTFDLINDHFGKMLFHPSSEMRALAERVLVQGRALYPYGIEEISKLKQRWSYVAGLRSFFYEDVKREMHFNVLMSPNSNSHHAKMEIAQSIYAREKHQEIPRHESENYRFRLGGNMDFGAFRDLHRHRNGVISMPLLTPSLGMHPWYLKELPPEIATEAAALLVNLENLIPVIYDMGIQLQYAVPMGARVNVRYDCGFNQLAYLLELRSGKTVHQTLREWTHEVWGEMNDWGPLTEAAARIFIDHDKDNFTLKRGTQTFNV